MESFRGCAWLVPLAGVQIVAGCSNFCSYCIVPHVRGPEASRPAASIVEEVAVIGGGGVREVTLLGQNVNAYGREPGFAGAEDFSEVLERVNLVPGIERVRFMTSHPKDMSGPSARPAGVSEPRLRAPAPAGAVGE